jgi:hypothetical protein
MSNQKNKNRLVECGTDGCTQMVTNVAGSGTFSLKRCRKCLDKQMEIRYCTPKKKKEVKKRSYRAEEPVEDFLNRLKARSC